MMHGRTGLVTFPRQALKICTFAATATTNRVRHACNCAARISVARRCKAVQRTAGREKPPRHHDYHNKFMLKVPINVQSCVWKWSRVCVSLNEVRRAKELWHTRKTESYKSTGTDYAHKPTKSRNLFGNDCWEVVIPRLSFVQWQMGEWNSRWLEWGKEYIGIHRNRLRHNPKRSWLWGGAEE
jgi:hypothetical protein